MKLNRLWLPSTLTMATILNLFLGCSAPLRVVSESVSGNGGKSMFDVGKSFKGFWGREVPMIEFIAREGREEWRLVPDGFQRTRGSGEDICFAHLAWLDSSATAVGVAKSCFSRKLGWAAFDFNHHAFIDPAPYRGELLRSVRRRYLPGAGWGDQKVMAWINSEDSTLAQYPAEPKVK